MKVMIKMMMKKTITNEIEAMVKFFLPFCLFTLLAFLTSCSQDGETAVQVPVGGLRFQLVDASSMPSRAATDGTTMVTTFELGDKAGLYVVKNGQVLKENVPLTYNASGFWEAAEAIKASEELSGAQFYAYYPYSASAVFDATSPTPFAAMVAATVPAANQSSKAAYEAADIMVSPAASVGQYNAVTLPLLHQKAMVCMELPNSSYITTKCSCDSYFMYETRESTSSGTETGIALSLKIKRPESSRHAKICEALTFPSPRIRLRLANVGTDVSVDKNWESRRASSNTSQSWQPLPKMIANNSSLLKALTPTYSIFSRGIKLNSGLANKAT